LAKVSIEQVLEACLMTFSSVVIFCGGLHQRIDA